MASRIHALEVHAVVALLGHHSGVLRIARADNTAGEEPHAGADGGALTATEQPADRGAENRTGDGAACTRLRGGVESIERRQE